MKSAAIVTMRTNSKRLPGKALSRITDHKRAVDIIIQRAKLTELPVILATSISSSDDELSNIAVNHKIEVFRGSLLNKIKRWYDCFEKFQIETALLIDGDDLCYDYDVAKRAMKQLSESGADIIMSPEEIVTGLFTLAVTKNAIKKLYDIAPLDSLDTDVFTHLLKKANLIVQFVQLHEYERNKPIRLTLDYEEDLEFFKKLYSVLDIQSSGTKILSYIETNKDLAQINYHKQKDFLQNKLQTQK